MKLKYKKIMTIASIDIGTNTVLLLIAETDDSGQNIKTLLNEYRIPRIGKGLSPGGRIKEEKSDALFEVLNDYSGIIKSYGCDKIIATATNALRTASNGKEIAGEIKKRFGIPVDIISGEEEAKYSFLGAAGTAADDENILVIDIGGGSSELVYGRGSSLEFRKSHPIGVVSGTEKYLMHAPPSEEELNSFSAALDRIFAGLTESEIRPQRTIAIAGTPTTLACIKLNLHEYNEDLIEGSELTSKEINNLIEILSRLSTEEILSRFKVVVKGREDILLAGTIILHKIIDLLNIDKVIVSTKGIRYGAIRNYLNSAVRD